ncbi:MAG: hypothetical protein PWQ97_1696 [Tepidanaerobacteraceae bacterium]|jgi:hypothetical protein|nr:hypothetical protein [Tepidanaerobacteraceae bacterium]
MKVTTDLYPYMKLLPMEKYFKLFEAEVVIREGCTV